MEIGAGGLKPGNLNFHLRNPRKQVIGSLYLFDKWKNLGIIVTSDDDSLLIRNINLNIDKQILETKYAKDSIFDFRFDYIKKIIVNNKSYYEFDHKSTKRLFEVIYESDSFSILKSYRIVYTQGSNNPMLNPNNYNKDKIKKKYSYYLKKGDDIKPFKLNKKRVLKLFSGYEDEILAEYVKKNKLSYSKEYDVNRIISFISKTQ